MRDNQLSLFDSQYAIDNSLVSKTRFKIIAWNIQSSALERAKLQYKYLLDHYHDADVIVLLELKSGKGFDYLTENLNLGGFRICYVQPPSNGSDYITVIAVKTYSFQNNSDRYAVKLSSARVASITIGFGEKEIEIVGAYLPTHSQFSSNSDILSKKQFHSKFIDILAVSGTSKQPYLVLIGDLNILEPLHKPYEPCFRLWEADYNCLLSSGLTDAFRQQNADRWDVSWISARGEKQWRLDHAFIDTRIEQAVAKCEFNHSVRTSRLSDHSLMILELDLSTLPIN